MNSRRLEQIPPTWTEGFNRHSPNRQMHPLWLVSEALLLLVI
ncbi:hypothetical protein [Oscillatoria sp. FACHB-1407]|nr:hypothetical protein [Oscillatoria sp. FACHB-1407]